MTDLVCVVRNSTTNILAKYKDATPSFIIHLHPTHFRFDQQVYAAIYTIAYISGGRVLVQQSHEGNTASRRASYRRLFWNIYETNKSPTKSQTSSN